MKRRNSAPAGPPPQMSLFAHSDGVSLHNDMVAALCRRDDAACDTALTAVLSANANDSRVPAYVALREYLAQAPHARLAREALRARLTRLETEVSAAAHQALGSHAADWLVECWRELAAASVALDFAPQDEALHAAPLWLRAQRWQDAARCAEAIPNWRRQPAPLDWVIAARYRSEGLTTVLPWLCELAWMAPVRAESLAHKLEDRVLGPLLQRFDHEFEGDDPATDFAWFPAWLLVAQPDRSAAVRLALIGALNPPEAGARLVLALQVHEAQGQQQEIAVGRARLRVLHSGLFECYMASR